MIVHKLTPEIVCPWCGHTLMDSWELEDEDRLICSNCYKMFSYTRETFVYYNTNKED